MTQAVNLMTGTAASAKTDSSFLKRDQSQLIIEEFAGIMNQNAQSFLSTVMNYQTRSDDTAGDIFAISDAGKSAQTDYAKLSQGNRTITEAESKTVDASDYAGEVSELAEEVENVVQETMQVSEEELENAMEALGFSAMDLLNPQNLIQLAQTLAGSDDVSALLTSESFQLTLQEVTGLVASFQQDNGLNAAEFTDLLAQLSDEIATPEETVQEVVASVEEQPEQTLELAGQTQEELKAPENVEEAVEQTAQGGQQTVTASAQQTETVQPQTRTSAESEETVEEQPVMQTDRKTSEQSAQTESGETDTSSQDGREEKTFAGSMEEQTSGIAENTHMFQPAGVTESAQPLTPQAAVPQVMSYLEVEQLMNQMEGLARAFSSAEGTTLEMQLNPESLGKLFLTVTEKQGAVTAQITASNEQVKEALQTQLIELRETLQAQGLKVEAVEVTVATHEFEQNLDGNASANTGMQEQEERQTTGGQGGRRNLNIDSLDELAGLMSEEETLVAQMMRDNGGTVDYTA